MKLYQLSQFLTLPNAHTTLPFHNTSNRSENVTLKNQYSVVLFENITLKLGFYRALSIDNAHIVSAKPHPSLVVLECGGRVIEEALPEYTGAHFANCLTPEILLRTLREIPETTSTEIGKCVLSTIIVDNISAFYWDEKRLPRNTAAKWYLEVNAELRTLMERYSCNVIVTMWDRNYERGFNSRPSDQKLTKLDSLTYTPAEFFQAPDYIFASRSGDKLWYHEQQWKVIEER